jgi:hypothetical protein
VQSEVRVAPGEIKTKTPRISRISPICRKTLVKYWGRRLDTIEAKATAALIAERYAQVPHYLTATGLRLALLLNIGVRSLQFKRIIRRAY